MPPNPKSINEARDDDARNALVALQRAALRARQTAAQTQTALVVVKDGKLVREMVDWGER